MPLIIPKNVLEAAIGAGTIRPFKSFTLVLLDGEGALSIPNDVWLPAAAWGRSRAPSGNRMRDRFQLMQRLEVLVTRRGTSVISTNGAHMRLARLRDAMKQDGIDLKEWNFPPDEILDQALNPGQRAETRAEAQAEAKAKSQAQSDAETTATITADDRMASATPDDRHAGPAQH